MESDDVVYSKLDQKYHGLALTTTRDAWRYEISFMHKALLPWKDDKGNIIFEYDIPRLGKRIDVVVLLRGIIFCFEFKVGEQNVLVLSGRLNDASSSTLFGADSQMVA